MQAGTCAPPVLLTGPVLGGAVAALLSLTTTLYLNHDRDNKEWIVATQANYIGRWPLPSADFDWCEPNYLYTPWIAEMWNTLTSLLFLVGPMLLWTATTSWSVRLNLLLVAAIGLGSAAFHATLQYEAQLPMIMYIVHTVALLSRNDVACPPYLWYCGFALSLLLFATGREAAAHKAGRVIMVLSFSGCFVWLAFSLAPLCSSLDSQRAGGADYPYTRIYQSAALAVLVSILSWVTDNLACRQLHSLPFGLPYPQLHAIVWHTGMAYVCGSLCFSVVGKQQQRAKDLASAQCE